MENNKNKYKNHQNINKQLKLYYICKENPGMIFWNANGLIIINNIKKFLKKIFKKYNYIEVSTPILMNKNIWTKSGHWKNYKKSMFHTHINKKTLCIKPMNCPGHIFIYKQKITSYKRLPIKISEFGICHRNEKSGSLYGLLRTRTFTQDDAHIFCTTSQITKEILNCIKLTFKIYNKFNFKNIKIHFSTRPPKYIGNKKKWIKTEKKIIKILKKNNINYSLKIGKGAFYGPKIEFILKDSLNRKWQCGTIQLDLYLTKKLNAYYINKNNKKKNPVLIHRAILGSLERFVGILIEEYNGWIPLWLTPIQIVIINISEKYIKYCKKIFKKLKKHNIRILSDFKNKKVNFKIRQYTLQKVPYMILCGNKEMMTNTINIRNTQKETSKNVNINYLINKIKKKTKQYI